MIPRPTRSTLFPYTTLFRSGKAMADTGLWEAMADTGLREAMADTGLSVADPECWERSPTIDRKSTRLNSSHVSSSYAVFCVKKKRFQLWQRSDTVFSWLCKF